MDELLRYALFQLALGILILELLIIAICLVVIMIFKSYYALQNRWNLYVQDQLSALITNSLANNQTAISIPSHLRGFRNLLFTMTAFNRRITDSAWEELKNHLVKIYLLHQAKKWVNSRFWTRRLLAAQCFVLNPAIAEREELSILLDDPTLLVRVVAAEAIVKADHRDLFIEVIRKISKESELAKMTYRDILIHADHEKFEIMIESLKKERDPAVSAVCLDLLTTRTTQNLFPLIIPFIYGSHVECRFLAVKILKNIPSDETTDVLFHCLKDDNWEIRAEALKSLSPPLVKKAVSTIEELLHDPVWFVRLQAALVLKKLGEEGLQALSNRNPEKEPEAYEISQYAMGLVEA